MKLHPSGEKNVSAPNAPAEIYLPNHLYWGLLMRTRLLHLTLIAACVFLAPATALRAQNSADQHEHMPGMEHKQHEDMEQSPEFIQRILQHESSGTGVEPGAGHSQMLMWQRSEWMVMFHGVAFLNFEQQSGPRGDDKVFSTNWFMPMAQRSVGPGQLTVRTMLSLEPATVTHRFYPELFQQGETAFGRPIIDGQHPHDFLMEIAALYDWKLGEQALLSFYAAPVGDPAFGPVAYPHRASASENPLAALGHHLEDSTHIVSDVLTTGFSYKLARLEASGFHGREPDEHRWDLDSGKIDSWSTRLTVQPAHNWAAQYSFTHLTSPEELHPEEDLQRMTASISYKTESKEQHSFAATLLWGRNHSLMSGENFNGYLAEATWHVAPHGIWGRIENVDRTTELLLGKQPEPIGFEDRFLARIQAYTIGYDHEFNLVPGLSTALGGQVTFYTTPSTLKTIYGDHPRGAVLFLRVRPMAAEMHQH